MTASVFFEPFSDFLSHTIGSEKNKAQDLAKALSTGDARLLSTGVFTFTPRTLDLRVSQNGLLLSAGIHGNETGPIEILNRLVSDILEDSICPERPLMVILGNPRAIAKQQRFVEVNMNRLFNGYHQQDQNINTVDGQRAAQIESLVRGFHKQFGVAEHLDLHTAIRGSIHERFALYPYNKNKTPRNEQRNFLQSCAVDHLLIQRTTSSTFSSFTMTEFGAESYTIELGKVKPFGQNQLQKYQNVYQGLVSLASNRKIPPCERTFHYYEVCHEIINTGDHFQLNVSEDIENFSSFKVGDVIWRDRDTEFLAQTENELIIFPNSKVPVGQRAGLIIKQVNQ